MQQKWNIIHTAVSLNLRYFVIKLGYETVRAHNSDRPLIDLSKNLFWQYVENAFTQTWRYLDNFRSIAYF